jgi:hypothetical protein
MSLKNYRQLSRETKVLATRYWLAVVLDELQLKNPNQLAAKLKENINVPGHAKCSASLLYRKWKDSPIEGDAKIKVMDELVPGASQCLTNPLWQLLDCQPDQRQSTAILQKLNAHVTADLFKPSTSMLPSERSSTLTKDHIVRIGRFNSPDALTCLLALSLEKPYYYSLLEQCAYQLFIRLTIFTPLYIVRDELYALLYYNFFNKSAEQKQSNHIINNYDYVAFREPYEGLRIDSSFVLTTPEHLERLKIYYLEQTDHAIAANVINDNRYERMLFVYALENNDRGWILSALHSKKANKYMLRLRNEMKYINRRQ